jgi:DNA polymerase-3 subunit gamma/tau
VDHAAVVRLLELLGEAMEAVRAGADARTRLELALVKAAKPEVDGSMRALLARIERLEQGGSIGGGAPAPVRSAPVANTPAPAVAEIPMPPAPPIATEPPTAVEPALAPANSSPAVAPAAPAVSEQAPEQSAAPAAVSGAAPVARDLESVSSLWQAVVDLVRAENARLGAAIETSLPVGVDGDELTLAFSSSFLKKQAEKPADRATIGEALSAITGGRWRLSYELRDELPPQDRPAAQAQSEEELVRRFMEEFDAEEISTEPGAAGEAASAEDRERDLPVATSNEKGA